MTLPMRRSSRRRNQGKSVQAAARLMPEDAGRFRTEEPSNAGGFTWQTRAWHVVKHLGIVHYGMDFIKDNVAQIEFFVARTSDDPEDVPEPVDLDDPAALELERISSGPYGGVSDLIAQHVVHNEAAGEGYLSVRYERDGIPIAPPEADVDNPFAEPGEDVTEVWEVLTPQTRKRRENDPKMRPVQSVRVWRPDPERPEWPDSSLRSVLTECEQLLLIQQHISGVLQSRLHSGVMVVPDELDPSQAGPPDEGDDEMSPLMRDMFEVFSSPIKDPDAAAAIMPYLLFGKAELLKEVRHLTISREFDSYILELAEHVKFAIAGGLDLPAERLLGMGGSNHWNVWYLDESTYVQHLAPDVDLVVDGLLRAWLRPAWAAAGLDPDAYTVVANPEKLTMMSSAGMPGTSNIPADEFARRATAAGILIRSGFAAEAVLEAVGLPEIPHTGFLPTTVTERPTPEVESIQAAATVEDLGTMLADIDDRVLSDLLALADEAIATEAADAEERLAEAMAAAGISADTPDLAQALADAGVSPAAVVPDDAFDQISDEAQRIMEDGMSEAAIVMERVSGVLIDESTDTFANVAAGATFLTVAMTDWLRSRWFNPRPGGDEGLAALARQGVGELEVPPGLIVDAMTEAGGGIGSTPGSRGLANARTVEGWLLQAGLATRAYRWVYPDFPRENFNPHRRLRGVIFNDENDERIANNLNSWPHNEFWYPKDHRRCACRWERVLVPVETVP